MNTPTHLILAAAVFAKPDQPRVTAAALAGAFLPDFSLYFMVFWHSFVLGNTASEIFGIVYFSDFWQKIFAIDNSFLIWGAAMALALWWRRRWAIALAGAGLLHLLIDFPLHNDDARSQFWPVTDWKFESPVSYWDPDHFGGALSGLEAALIIVLCVILWRRFQSVLPRVIIAATGGLSVSALDLSRFRAAPITHLCSLCFEGQGAFPAQS